MTILSHLISCICNFTLLITGYFISQIKSCSSIMKILNRLVVGGATLFYNQITFQPKMNRSRRITINLHHQILPATTLKINFMHFRPRNRYGSSIMEISCHWIYFSSHFKLCYAMSIFLSDNWIPPILYVHVIHIIPPSMSNFR